MTLSGANPADQGNDGSLAVDLVPSSPSAGIEADDLKKLKETLETALERATKPKGWLRKAPAAAAAAAPRKAPAAAASAATKADADEPFEKAFARLPREEQLRKVEAYARMDDGSRVQMAHLGEAARKALHDLSQVCVLLNLD